MNICIMSYILFLAVPPSPISFLSVDDNLICNRPQRKSFCCLCLINSSRLTFYFLVLGLSSSVLILLPVECSDSPSCSKGLSMVFEFQYARLGHVHTRMHKGDAYTWHLGIELWPGKTCRLLRWWVPYFLMGWHLNTEQHRIVNLPWAPSICSSNHGSSV